MVYVECKRKKELMPKRPLLSDLVVFIVSSCGALVSCNHREISTRPLYSKSTEWQRKADAHYSSQLRKADDILDRSDRGKANTNINHPSVSKERLMAFQFAFRHANISNQICLTIKPGSFFIHCETKRDGHRCVIPL